MAASTLGHPLSFPRVHGGNRALVAQLKPNVTLTQSLRVRTPTRGGHSRDAAAD